MMQNFGPSLDRERVRYLLISGQATILYGAATFSQDIDLWVEPRRDNIRRLVRALASLGAHVYKLTPSLTERNFRRGHGFHFLLPNEPGPNVYLDIMGQPPRVASFGRSWRHKRWFETAWGRMPVVSPEDLVNLKRTRRLGDYEIISNLVELRTAESKSRAILEWGMLNTFRVDDLWQIVKRLGCRHPRRAGARILAGRRTMNLTMQRNCADALAIEIRQHQEADTVYWRPIINELKALRARRKLVPEGTPVRELAGSSPPR